MDESRARLIKCFELDFPDLPADAVPSASQSTLPEWDSVAAITMMNVIEDEFGIEMDLEEVAGFDSFERIHDYVAGRVSA
jgi:acyl carrier protein